MIERESGEPDLTERQRYWLEHLRAWEKGGGSMKDYAAAHGLGVKEFYSWKQVLGERGLLAKSEASPPLFQRVVLEQRTESLCRIEYPNGVRIEIGGPLSSAMLVTIFRSVGGMP